MPIQNQPGLPPKEWTLGRKITIEGYTGYVHSNIWTEFSHRCTALLFPLPLILANRLEGNWQWQHHTQQRLPPPVHSLQPSSKTRFWTWDLNFQYFYHSPTSLIHCTFVLDQLLFNLKPKQLSSFEDMVGKTLAHDKIPVKASPKNPTASLSLESKQS